MNIGAILFGVFGVFFSAYIIKDTFYDDKKDEIRKSNTLYKCDSCNRLFRQYQVDLIKAKIEKERCPHCEKEIVEPLERHFSMLFDKELNRKPRDTKTTATDIRKEDSWMGTHPDCPKITDKKHYKSIIRLIETIKKNKESQDEFDRFMEYNKIKVDSNWINKINKNKSE